MQQLSGQGLSVLARVSWKLRAPMSRWLAVQRSFGFFPPATLSQSVAFRHGARHSPSRPQRGARGIRCCLLLRVLEVLSPREFLPRRPSLVSLLARAASLSRTPPPPGSVPYWVRSRLAKRCLRELFSRDFRDRLPVVAWKISATGARAGAVARAGVVRGRPGQRLQGDRGGPSLKPQSRLPHVAKARRSRRG